MSNFSEGSGISQGAGERAPKPSGKPVVRSTMEVPAEEVKMQGVKDATIRKIFTEKEGAPNFAMRLFEVAPGGYTPLHHHTNEHEVYIIEGNAVIETGENPISLKPGDAVFVPPNALHQFKNAGDSPLRFLCLVPLQK